MSTDKPDCSRHSKQVGGFTDMRLLARSIVDLHYESLAELYKHLSIELNKDARKDAADSKINLSIELMNAAHNTELAYLNIERCWKISKPFMEKTNT